MNITSILEFERTINMYMMKIKVLIMIPFLDLMQNQREEILILEIMINLRQHRIHLIRIHLHQTRIQREINLEVLEEAF